MNFPDIDLGLVKDIGGWAVVLIIVRWMMMRIDTLIASSERTMMATIEEFRSFRQQEQEQHASLEKTQDRIVEILIENRRRRGQ